MMNMRPVALLLCASCALAGFTDVAVAGPSKARGKAAKPQAPAREAVAISITQTTLRFSEKTPEAELLAAIEGMTRAGPNRWEWSPEGESEEDWGPCKKLPVRVEATIKDGVVVAMSFEGSQADFCDGEQKATDWDGQFEDAVTAAMGNSKCKVKVPGRPDLSRKCTWSKGRLLVKLMQRTNEENGTGAFEFNYELSVK